MPDVDVAGVRIHYEVVGSGERLPVLLSHGFSASAAMWRPNLAALSSERRVITWDMRGHGKTESPSDPARYSAELTMQDMAALLEHAGVECVVLVGLSLGGYFSLMFAGLYPERVAALVLCDTGPGFRNDDARDAWNLAALETAQRWEEGGVPPLAARPEVAPLAQQDVRGIARAARGMLVQRGSRVIDSLAGLRAPTLVVVGEDDTNFRAPANYMATKIAGARLVVIPHAGHAVNIDQPAAFNREVGEFLGSVP